LIGLVNVALRLRRAGWPDRLGDAGSGPG
jgi:hypothetical protein